MSASDVHHSENEAHHDQSFPCVICGKCFQNQSHLLKHQCIRTGKKLFTCTRCDRSFTTHYSLKRHQLIHDKEEMMCSCTVCGELFCQEHLISVRNQHNMEQPVHPEELLDIKSLPKSEPEEETIDNLTLKAILKEEQKARKMKRKYKYKRRHLYEEHSPSAVKEEQPNQSAFHSDVPQVYKRETKYFSSVVQRSGQKIQRIAYDIEIIV